MFSFLRHYQGFLYFLFDSVFFIICSRLIKHVGKCAHFQYFLRVFVRRVSFFPYLGRELSCGRFLITHFNGAVLKYFGLRTPLH